MKNGQNDSPSQTKYHALHVGDTILKLKKKDFLNFKGTKFNQAIIIYILPNEFGFKIKLL